MSLLFMLSGVEIMVWSALLFTIGFVIHFFWIRHQLFPTEVSNTDQRFRQETEKWKQRFFKETETLSRELDRVRRELESAQERNESLHSAIEAKDELLTTLKQERHTYRDLLTTSLQSTQSVEQNLDHLVSRSTLAELTPQPAQLDGQMGHPHFADIHQAEARIEELELRLMDQEDTIQRLQSGGGASVDVNEELLDKISQLESQLIQARSRAALLEKAQTRIRELEEQLSTEEQRRQSMADSHHRLTEENHEQYQHFREQMSELKEARQRLAQYESQSEELQLLEHRNQELRDKVRELGEYKSKVEG